MSVDALVWQNDLDDDSTLAWHHTFERKGIDVLRFKYDPQGHTVVTLVWRDGDTVGRVDLNRLGDHVMRVYPPTVRIPPGLELPYGSRLCPWLVSSCMSMGRRWCVVVRPYIGPPVLGFQFYFPGMTMAAFSSVCRLREVAAAAVDDEAYVQVPAIPTITGKFLIGSPDISLVDDLIGLDWRPGQIEKSVYY